MSRAYLRCMLTLAMSALGGCQTTFGLVGVAVPLSAGESHRFDGSYQGRIDQVSHTGPDCPASEGERVVMVGDGVLWYAYSSSTLFTLPVAYDGVVDGRTGDTTLSGTITGNHMALTVKSPACQSRLSMDYIYNHS